MSHSSSRLEQVSRRQLIGLASVGLAVPLAGCSTSNSESTPAGTEVSVTIRLQNGDDQPREYRVVVQQGDGVTNEFSGTIPAREDGVEMIATLRAREGIQHEFQIRTNGGQQGRTWDPIECPDFVVDATIEDGTPEFESRCRSA